MAPEAIPFPVVNCCVKSLFADMKEIRRPSQSLALDPYFLLITDMYDTLEVFGRYESGKNIASSIGENLNFLYTHLPQMLREICCRNAR